MSYIRENIGNNIDLGYLNLLEDILENGTEKQTRSGKVTSVFGRQIRHDMSLGFPLLTTKRVAFNQIKSELKWFLKGSTDIRDLWKDNNHIWNGDWYKKYRTTCSSPYSLDEIIEFGLSDTPNHFSKDTWTLGPIYGHQWKSWGGSYTEQGGRHFTSSSSKGIDQIQQVMDDLKNNPDSRRIMVNAWNVDQIQYMTLPPCHYGFQFWTRESTREEKITNPGKYRVLSLMWNQRSVDTPLGLPFNIASYALLLEMMASEVNMIAGELIGNLGDTHIYQNQIEGVMTQLKRSISTLPKIKIQDGMYSSLDSQSKDIILENYKPQPKISFPLSN